MSCPALPTQSVKVARPQEFFHSGCSASEKTTELAPLCWLNPLSGFRQNEPGDA